MTERRVVVVTGAASYWGGLVAEHLAAHPELYLIGLDHKPPPQEIAGVDFIRVDTRNPLLAELLQEESVHTVCHLNFIETVAPSEAAFEANVLGSMHLLSACVQAGVSKVVLKSSTAVYGAQPTNSAFLREDAPFNGDRHYGTIRDLIEIETFCQNLQRQYPDLLLTMLRFANVIGPTVDSAMTQFLRNNRAPALLGFDPMIRVIHEVDVVAAIAQAVLHDVHGTFNVAAEEAMPLRKLMSLAGKLPFLLFHPVAYAGLKSLKRRRLSYSSYAPLPLDYLRYPWVSDLTEMQDTLNFTPTYTAAEAAQAFANRHSDAHNSVATTHRDQDEERLREIIERRRRARTQAE